MLGRRKVWRLARSGLDPGRPNLRTMTRGRCTGEGVFQLAPAGRIVDWAGSLYPNIISEAIGQILRIPVYICNYL
jgi:hypothetical protein